MDAATGETLSSLRYSAQWGYADRSVVDDGVLFTPSGYFGGLAAFSLPEMSVVWQAGDGGSIFKPRPVANDQFVFAFGEYAVAREAGLRTELAVAGVTDATVIARNTTAEGDVMANYGGTVDGQRETGSVLLDGQTLADQDDRKPAQYKNVATSERGEFRVQS